MSKLFDQINSELPDAPQGQAGAGDLFSEINQALPDIEGAGGSNWIDQYAKMSPSFAPRRTAMDNIVDVGQGAGKGILSTLRGASTLGENMLKSIGRIVTPKSWEEKLGFAKTEKSSADELLGMTENKLGLDEGSLTTPNNNWEKGGFITEQALEFLIPSSKIAKLEKGMPLLNKAALEAGIVGGQTAIQKGEINNDEVKTAALIGAVFPVAGAAVSALAKPVKSAIGRALVDTSESGLYKIIKPVKQDIDKGFKLSNVFKHDVQGSLAETLAKTELKLNNLYGSLKSALKESKEEVDFESVLGKTYDRLFNKGKAGGFVADIANGSLGNVRRESVKALTKNNDEVFKNFADAGGIKRVYKNLVNDLEDVTDGTYRAGLYESNLIKQGAGTKGAWHYLVTPDHKPIEVVYNTFYDVLKEEIENVAKKSGIKNVQQLNKAMSELIPIKSAVLRRMPVADRQNVVGLTDSIFGLGALFNPQALALLGLSKLSKSGKFMAYLHNAGERLQGLRPAQRGAIAERIFGGNIDDLKNVKPGLTIEDVTRKEATSLFNEAKKYKNVDDFVKAQGGEMYHGTGKKYDGGKILPSDPLKNIKGRFGNPSPEMTETISISENAKTAKIYTDGTDGEVLSVYIKPKKTLDLTAAELTEDALRYNEINKSELNWNDFIDTWGTTKKAGDFLKEKGYDSIKIIPSFDIGEKGVVEIRALDPEIIKTKSQLIDIWKEANKQKTRINTDPSKIVNHISRGEPVLHLNNEGVWADISGLRPEAREKLIDEVKNIRFNKKGTVHLSQRDAVDEAKEVSLEEAMRLNKNADASLRKVGYKPKIRTGDEEKHLQSIKNRGLLAGYDSFGKK